MIIRVDGRAFHTYTKKFKRLGEEGPWSTHMQEAMSSAAKSLMSEISGAKLAYAQSDEISVLVTDYDSLTTQAWFGKSIQKVASVSSSIATVGFNTSVQSLNIGFATFDSRAFVLPKEEVANYFIWRQKDAIRNSVAMLAQAHFSSKQLHGKGVALMRKMLLEEKQVSWDSLPSWQKRGWCVSREIKDKPEGHRTVISPDLEVPEFSSKREYVEKHVLLKYKCEVG